MAATPASTGTGECWSSPVPSPSCPELFDPQHDSWPPCVTAQEYARPVATCVTCDRPGTCTGDRCVVVVPSPSWPWKFEPQQKTAPSARAAHACPPPTFRSTMAPRPTAALTGVRLDVVEPLPNVPAELSPQHVAWPVLSTRQLVSGPSARRPTPARLFRGTRAGADVGASAVLPLPS